MSKVKEIHQDHYTLPGLPLTQPQVQEMIKKAEEGKFINIQELKDRITSWKAKSSK